MPKAIISIEEWDYGAVMGIGPDEEDAWRDAEVLSGPGPLDRTDLKCVDASPRALEAWDGDCPDETAFYDGAVVHRDEVPEE